MKQRLITSVVISVLTLYLMYSQGPLLSIVLSMIGLWGTWELFSLINKIPCIIKLVGACAHGGNNDSIPSVTEKARHDWLLSIIALLMPISAVLLACNGLIYSNYLPIYVMAAIVITLFYAVDMLATSRALAMHASITTLGLFWTSMISFYWLNQTHQRQLIYVVLLTAISDMMGYFVGKSIGGAKPFKQLSPNKTEFGTLAMLITPAIIAGYLAYQEYIQLNGFWLSIGLISLIGDLWMSALKRTAQVKDTGALLPGHGGILDRLDSHILVLSIAWFVLQ